MAHVQKLDTDDSMVASMIGDHNGVHKVLYCTVPVYHTVCNVLYCTQYCNALPCTDACHFQEVADEAMKGEEEEEEEWKGAGA